MRVRELRAAFGWAAGLALAVATLDALGDLLQLEQRGLLVDRYLADAARSFALHALVGVGLGAAALGVLALAMRFAPAARGAAGPPVRHATSAPAAGLRFARGCSVAVWLWVLCLGLSLRHGRALWGVEPAFGPLEVGVAGAVCAVLGFAGELALGACAVRPRLGRTLGTLALVGLGGAAILVGVRQARGGLDDFLARASRLELPPLQAGTAAASGDHPSVLLVTIDTLRADYVGAYAPQSSRIAGSSASATPHIDTLARDGVLFEQMIAQSSWTRPSLASLFTSLHPSQHGAEWRLLRTGSVEHQVFDHALRADVPTLAELFSEGGYATLGINTNIQSSSIFGFDRGFDHFVDVPRPLSLLRRSALCEVLEAGGWGGLLDCDAWSASDRTHPYLEAEHVVALFEGLFAEMERSGRPFFFWVHFMDPHVPYTDRVSGETITYDHIERWLAAGESVQGIRDRVDRAYVAEVRHVDAHVGRLLERLDRSSVAASTLVVLTSDHGEELFERRASPALVDPGLAYYVRGYGHGHTLYDELLRVPLMVRFPDRRSAGRRDERLVQHVDLLPTFLDWAGLEADAVRLEGRSLLASDAPGEAHALARSESNCYGPALAQVRTADGKLILHTRTGEAEYFAIDTDPRERENRSGRGERRQAELAASLERWRDRMRVASQATADERGESEEVDVSDDLRSRLRALGYLQ